MFSSIWLISFGFPPGAALVVFGPDVDVDVEVEVEVEDDIVGVGKPNETPHVEQHNGRFCSTRHAARLQPSALSPYSQPTETSHWESEMYFFQNLPRLEFLI